MFEFFTEKYTSKATETLPSWIFDTFDDSQLEIHDHVLVEVLEEMKKGRTCADDGLVVEMIKDLGF